MPYTSSATDQTIENIMGTASAYNKECSHEDMEKAFRQAITNNTIRTTIIHYMLDRVSDEDRNKP